MVRLWPAYWLALVTPVLLLMIATPAVAQEMGGIRGVVRDENFDMPLGAARITITQTGASVTSGDDGNYVLNNVPAGTYTLAITKDGYDRKVKPDVAVVPGQMTDLDITLAADTTPMEMIHVVDLELGGIDTVLENKRKELPQILDSVSDELIRNAGLSDAAAALRLVPGATVQDGKYPVVRGLPDRYVNSQMNGVRLPTADADKRAVQLDQFPTAVIESIQVSKSFTPDQQGDASGGAVNIVLKGIPEKDFIQVNTSSTFNTHTTANDKFLTYPGGGVNFLGLDESRRPRPNGSTFGGEAAGVSRGDAPLTHDFSITGGGKHEFDTGFKIGGLVSLFHKEDLAFFDDGIDDAQAIQHPGDKQMVPQSRVAVEENDFKTALYNVTRGTDSVKTGGMASLGTEIEHHSVTLVYIYTRTADDTATLAQDTRGKAYYFPGYNVNDPYDPGNAFFFTKAPYNRTETLAYTERETQMLQLHGQHTFPIDPVGAEDYFSFVSPEADWTLAHSSSSLNQPDKRLFSEEWLAPRFVPGMPGTIEPGQHLPYRLSDNGDFGNFQQIFKDILEQSNQFSVNLKFPFQQWSDDKGYIKIGMFDDAVRRWFRQETFTNPANVDQIQGPIGPFDLFWSSLFPSESHIVVATEVDANYTGRQDILAWYGMADLPITHFFKLIGGARVESTELQTSIQPEAQLFYYPPGVGGAVQVTPQNSNISRSEDDLLPSIGFELKPFDKVTLRGSYAQTIARPIFKELVPIAQVEYLGSSAFVGNPALQFSHLDNYDLRVDYTPVAGTLLSASYFFKDVTGAIEYVEVNRGAEFITPENFPNGTINGVEVEARFQLGQYWDPLKGLSVGGNATFLQSKVNLSKDELLSNTLAGFPQSTRPMTGAPDLLYNINATYDWEHQGWDDFGTQFGLFYTVRGDSLKAGGSPGPGGFVPDLFEKEYETLNLTIGQKLGKYFRFTFQVRNLTDPRIEEVYRAPSIGHDVVKTSYTKGIDFVLGFGAKIDF